jgi:hypothetical protein
MYRKHMLQALDFEDQNIFNQQIEAVTAIKLDSFVLHRKRNLPLEGDIAESKFVAKAFFVC